MDGKTADGSRHTIVVDGYTARQLWQMRTRHENPSMQLTIADDAAFLMQFVQHADDGAQSALFKLADGTLIKQLPFYCNALSPDGQLGLQTRPENQCCDLFDIANQTRLVRLQLVTVPSNYQPNFSPDGNYAAWANRNGTISVCDLRKVREDLKLIDASW